MSDEKDDLRSIKVYKFNNTKENWHEFALKFRVIADSRGYEGIIDGTVNPPPPQQKRGHLNNSRRKGARTEGQKREADSKASQ